MLRDMEKHKGAAMPLHDVSALPKLQDLGISRTQSHRWQVEQEVPEEDFEKYVAKIKNDKEELI